MIKPPDAIELIVLLWALVLVVLPIFGLLWSLLT
jgi:hypothetical protein